jgi:NADPH-dependent 2,4-dienoyl-CoA reductase/sulfur reductase-like enzyme/ferredoxin
MAPEPRSVPVELGRREEAPPFPSYLQVPTRVPLRAWRAARALTVPAALALCVVLVAWPQDGLTLTWKVLVPTLPLVWFAAPGLWRNLCPLAASNQVPRLFGFSWSATPPRWLSRYSYVLAAVAFFGLVPARKVLFNRSGPATAALLLVVLALALAGGLAFKGKSGWCSSVCPLLPVQRMYGETPFVRVRNSHCEPCVGCAKNCYDFNPRVAKLADLDDPDDRWAAPRRLFTAAFPGLVFGFFSLPNVSMHAALWTYGHIGLYAAVSITVFTLLRAFGPMSDHQLTALFAAVALNAFYWYSVPTFVGAVGHSPEGLVRSLAVWSGRAFVLALTIPWMARTFRKERRYRADEDDAAVVPAPALEALGRLHPDPAVRFLPGGPEVAVAPGTRLLEVIQGAELPIEAGCWMGVCGADPVAVVEGGECLSPIGRDEADTLARLGFDSRTRLACQARVGGPCTVSLQPERAAAAGLGPAVHVVAAAGIHRIVILGNGIAGTTAADHARRLDPDLELHLVGAEPHRLYNRMAITRLIHGRSAMQGLYLLPDSWYDANDVTCWLNTQARAIDLAARTVTLATGEHLEYDRLVLATGSRSRELEIPGAALPGAFTMRRAEDAIAVRAFAQEHGGRTAVVAGGGLLGLEAAYALHKLGVDTTIVTRSGWVAQRELDEAGARLLERYLEALGISILTDASPGALHGDRRVEAVELSDGRLLDSDLFVACLGIVPNVELAQAAGLAVARGVLVDERMQTSDAAVYAAGDVAQLGDVVAGLWPVSARQGEVAGVNAAGGDARFAATPTASRLKVHGIEVVSIGQPTTVLDGDEVVTIREEDEARYRKLVLRDGRIVGAILIGDGLDVSAVQRAMDEAQDVTALRSALEAGDWSVLDRALVPAS